VGYLYEFVVKFCNILHSNINFKSKSKSNLGTKAYFLNSQAKEPL